MTDTALDQIGMFAFVVIVGMCIIVAATMFSGEVFENYGVTNYTDVANATGQAAAFAKLNESANVMGRNLAQTNPANTNPFLMLFAGGYDALKQVFNVFDALRDLISGIIEFMSSVVGFNIGPLAYILLAAMMFWLTWKFLEVISGR